MNGMSRRDFGKSLVGCALASTLGRSPIALAAPATSTLTGSQRLVAKEILKVFDSKDGTGFGQVTNLASAIVDVSVIHRNGQWQMIGEASDVSGRLGFFSATLPRGKPLQASGWQIQTAARDPTSAVNLVPNSEDPAAWDYTRHNSSYVIGYDPGLNNGRGGWEERLYYAGTNADYGPFAIGYLVWDGNKWVVHGGNPVLTGTELWEGSTGTTLTGVYEPNVIYHDGKWRIWYATGSAAQGYAESVDGRSWYGKTIYQPPSQSVFDNQVLASSDSALGFEAVFARFALTFEPLPNWGLWWQHAPTPSADPAQWSEPVQVVVAGDGTPWHKAGVWKPNLCYDDADRNAAFLFFDGGYGDLTTLGQPFTLGCAICERQSAILP